MATISLKKGGNISLSKEDPSLKKVRVGLGWDARSTSGDDFDLDASAILLGANDKVTQDGDLVFYNNMNHPTGAVKHGGDNRTGDGDGDDESIEIDLSLVPDDIQKIVISVSIDRADERSQSFGQVRNAYVRLLNDETEKEIVRYDLTEDYSSETCLNFAEVYRHNNEWKFRAVGQGYNSGFIGLLTDFGLNVTA